MTATKRILSAPKDDNGKASFIEAMKFISVGDCYRMKNAEPQLYELKSKTWILVEGIADWVIDDCEIEILGIAE